MSVSKNQPSTQLSDSTCSSQYDLDIIYNLSIFRQDLKTKKIDETNKQADNKMKTNKKVCCVCTTSQLLHQCQKKDCTNSFHLHCISGYFPELLGKGVCPSHTFKNLEEVSKLMHLSSLFNSSPSLQSIVKTEKIGKKQSDLTGNFFWFGISQQYFPYINMKKPEFVSENNKNEDLVTDDSWISQKIKKVTGKHVSVTESLSELTKPLEKLSKNCCKRPKVGENIQNSTKLALNLQGKYIRNYEKIQITSYKHSLKNYHDHDSEEKIICAVCDDGESYEDNLIVICSKCDVAVHCWCYKIQELSEHDWLCDVCFAGAEEAVCSLCPVPGGALKKSKSSSWVHVTCARHLLNLPLKDFSFDLSKINPEKFRLKCFSCNLKTGACVQCSHGRCATAFHIECRKDLIEVSQSSIFWFCPNHKASKLTRQLKQCRDLSDDFISTVANILWKKLFPVEDQPKVKKQKKNVNLDLVKKKILLEIKQGQILMKVFVGNKMVKVLKYTETDGKSELKKKKDSCKTTEFDKQSEEIRTLTSLKLKVKRKNTEPDMTFLKTSKGDFTLKMKLPNTVLDTKKRKLV